MQMYEDFLHQSTTMASPNDSESSTQRKRGGKYCVCGAAGGYSCMNSVHTPGISMHKFPDGEKFPSQRRSWISFVRKHRPGFVPTEFSVLCSAHFEMTCYPLRYRLELPSNVKPRSKYLNPGAIPFVDTLKIFVNDVKTTFADQNH